MMMMMMMIIIIILIIITILESWVMSSGMLCGMSHTRAGYAVVRGWNRLDESSPNRAMAYIIMAYIALQTVPWPI